MVCVSRWLFVCALSTVLACGDDGGTIETSDGTSTTTDDLETTLPLTSVSISTDPSTSSTGASSDSSDGSTSGSSGGSSGDETASSSGPGDSSSSSTGAAVYEVGWCILQYPPTIEAGPGDVTVVYARVYVEGITDESEFVDEDPLVVSEFGYGSDGSDPTAGAWDWFAGEPNPGWDGTMAKGGFGQENNDEYQVDLAFDQPAIYDYAARFSADGGETWTYCDLDDSETGGYTPEQAGHAVIQ